jgi:hypothetical protein
MLAVRQIRQLIVIRKSADLLGGRPTIRDIAREDNEVRRLTRIHGPGHGELDPGRSTWQPQLKLLADRQAGFVRFLYR